jgi:glycosyltransferase involved in cell wall biosynthesis
MLCECIPVATKIGGMPAAIGGTGFYVPYGDVETTVVAIKKSLNCAGARGARERIKKMFPLKKRKDKLMQEINELFKDGRETNETE